jgi:hypothetical protein
MEKTAHRGREDGDSVLSVDIAERWAPKRREECLCRPPFANCTTDARSKVTPALPPRQVPQES